MTRFTFDVDATLAALRCDETATNEKVATKIQAGAPGKTPNVADVADVAVIHPHNHISDSLETGVGGYTPATTATSATFGPEGYDDALKRVLAFPPDPDLVPRARLELFAVDAQRFIDTWGPQALALGWTVSDLFGLDPVAPLARCDRMGLVWFLKGREHVIALTAGRARLSGGTSFYRDPAWRP